MASLQQQKDEIDWEAQKAKDAVDQADFDQRQAAADLESKKVRQAAEEEVAKIQYDAQR